jgi:phosphate starvation-inducible PhoH-like protein
MQEKRVLSRKEKRILRQNKENDSNIQKLNFNLKKIEPLTENQKISFEAYQQGKNLLLIGSAGSGKTFLSFYLSLNELFSEKNKKYNKVYICRSAEPSKNVGFLPGNLKEKTKHYEMPYYGICSELFQRGDAYEILKQKQNVEFISTSYIRGITLNDCIVIVDECQNLEWNELYAIMTRIGNNCKILFCGDYKQSDLKNNYKNDARKEDILKFIEVLKKMKSFKIVEFNHGDILRSEIVKEFIIESEKIND